MLMLCYYLNIYHSNWTIRQVTDNYMDYRMDMDSLTIGDIMSTDVFLLKLFTFLFLCNIF